MSKIKRAMEDIRDLGWPETNESLERLVEKRQKETEAKADSIELPSWFDGVVYGKGDIVKNPFSGQSVYIDRKALSIYDLIMGANQLKEYDIVAKGCDWFRDHYPKEYMILLD